MTRHEQILIADKAVKAILNRLRGQKNAGPKTLAEILMEKFSLTKDAAENMAAKIAPLVGGGATENTPILQVVISEIGKLNLGKKTVDDSVKRFVGWVNGSKIKLPKRFGDGRDFAQKQIKIGLKVINTKNLLPLDQWWEEASEKFPHFLNPDTAAIEDQFDELCEAVTNARDILKQQITGNDAIDFFGGKDGIGELLEAAMKEHQNGLQVTAYYFGKKLQRTKLVFSGNTKPYKDEIKKLGKAWFNQALSRWEVDVTGHPAERCVRGAAMPQAA